MRRFEVWRLVPKDKASEPRLVMILQSERIDHLATVVVAPLRPNSADTEIPNLTPRIEVNGLIYSVLIPFLAAIDKKQLQALVQVARVHEYEIDRAIDRLFMGI